MTSSLSSTSTAAPEFRVLSLGAGVQSTVLALMACSGELPGLEHAIFADTGYEPPAVYEQVDRLQVEFDRAGIPLHRVSSGNLREDTLDPAHRFVSVPYFTLAPEDATVPVLVACTACRGTDHGQGDSDAPVCPECDGSGKVPTGTRRPATRGEREGMGRRQCTSEYKLKPIKKRVRELLGYPHPHPVPRGVHAEQWIGFSTDELYRVRDRLDVLYSRPRYPLIELGMDRKACERWLRAQGWGHTAKSSCIGCPFHGNQQWRIMRDRYPDEWADAVDFDERIRKGGASAQPLNGEAFLHRSRLPLSIAPIDRVTPKEWTDAQLTIDDELAEHGDLDGCSPYGCRSGEAVA